LHIVEVDLNSHATVDR